MYGGCYPLSASRRIPLRKSHKNNPKWTLAGHVCVGPYAKYIRVCAAAQIRSALMYESLCIMYSGAEGSERRIQMRMLKSHNTLYSGIVRTVAEARESGIII